MKLIVEVNQKFHDSNPPIKTASGGIVMITPPLDDNYWVYRVKLKHGQAIVAFPKFGMIGCGFAKETDWNTNLPISCPAQKIFSHIKHNKKYKDIKDADYIAAIEAIQEVVSKREADDVQQLRR